MQHTKNHMFTSLKATMCGSMDNGYAVAMNKTKKVIDYD